MVIVKFKGLNKMSESQTNETEQKYSRDEMVSIRDTISKYIRLDRNQLMGLAGVPNTDPLIVNCILSAMMYQECLSAMNSHEMANAYLTHPPFLYYTYTDEEYGAVPMRIINFGFVRNVNPNKPDLLMADIVTPGINVKRNEFTTKYLKDCIPVKQWTASQLALIMSGSPTTDAFTIPMGYLVFNQPNP